MLTSQYARDFTGGERTKFYRVWLEIKELLAELLVVNFRGICEEFGDVVHHIQLWLYSCGLDARLWMWCARKFILRQEVWQAMHRELGLTCRACYGGNYHRPQKVINYFMYFGITPEAAMAAYRKVVGKE